MALRLLKPEGYNREEDFVMKTMIILAIVASLTNVGWAAEDRRDRDRDRDRGRANVETREGWTLLGSTVADFKKDRDRIDVGRSRGPFKQLMIEVDGGALEMEDVNVRFGDGSNFSPKTKLRFEEGSRTRNIDLPGNKREITHVDFTFRSTAERRGEATVKVYAR
jgi:hypothetical protein